LSEVYAIALSRLGLSVSEFDDLTPFELDCALRDHSEYHFAYLKEFMNLQRHIGTVLRNKGLKESAQYRDSRRLYRLSWEQPKEVHFPTEDEWKVLDKRYTRPAR